MSPLGKESREKTDAKKQGFIFICHLNRIFSLRKCGTANMFLPSDPRTDKHVRKERNAVTGMGKVSSNKIVCTQIIKTDSKVWKASVGNGLEAMRTT